MLAVKICGVTTVEDARLLVEAGADALGLNFVAGSPRRVDPSTARRIAAAVAGRVEIVGVVADESEGALRDLVREVGLDALQLHGDEAPEALAAIAAWGTVRAYKAVRVGDADDVRRALAYAGDLLVDAKVRGALGGTGQRADWALAAAMARDRRVVLAGGLDPANVAEAVRRVRPFGVDVASGVEVERAPRRKDRARVLAFVAAARAADAATSAG